MQKRHIRLKEYPPGHDQWATPSAEYLARTDGTLEPGPFRVRSDHDGFIMTGNNPPVTAKPVVFLGDSFVESIYAAEDERFVSSTERALRGAGLDVRFLNGGYSGSTTLQLLNVILNKVYPTVGPGGTVVVFCPHSDRDYLYKQGSYWSDTPRGATILPPGNPGHADIPRGMASAEMVLTLLVSTSQQLGLRLVLATGPYRTGDYETDPIFKVNYHGRRDWYDRGMMRRRHWSSLIEDVAMKTGTPFINGAGFIEGDSSCFFDELHLNTKGNHRFAASLAPALHGILQA